MEKDIVTLNDIRETVQGFTLWAVTYQYDERDDPVICGVFIDLSDAELFKKNHPNNRNRVLKVIEVTK